MSTITFDALRSKDVVTKTAVALTGRGMTAESVEKGAEALEKIIHMIPQGASVMNGASRTLEQIGYIEHLKSGQHGWNNLHAGIVAEKDPAKQGALRKQAVSSDFYLGSAHAVLAYSALGLLVLHVSAALWHHFVRRDAVLRRILPGTSVTAV